MKICLCVIYNHNYEGNIDCVKSIYKDRFSNVFQIMPFYTGNDKSIISVYEDSFFFSGYMAQSINKIYDPDVSHYVFIADDCFLNPNINEDNILEEMKLDENSSFIHHFKLLTNEILNGWWGYQSIVPAIRMNCKKELLNFLPDINDAIKCMKHHGLNCDNGYTLKNLKHICKYLVNKDIDRMCFNRDYNTRISVEIPSSDNIGYPLVCSGWGSDFIVIPKKSIKKFCHYCGIFAANNVFVEIAIPTAMVLSCDNIVTCRKNKCKMIFSYKMEWLEYVNEYDYKLSSIIDNFPNNILSIHPIKLSRLKK